jgi:hypothetical protein
MMNLTKNKKMSLSETHCQRKKNRKKKKNLKRADLIPIINPLRKIYLRKE